MPVFHHVFMPAILVEQVGCSSVVSVSITLAFVCRFNHFWCPVLVGWLCGCCRCRSDVLDDVFRDAFCGHVGFIGIPVDAFLYKLVFLGVVFVVDGGVEHVVCHFVPSDVHGECRAVFCHFDGVVKAHAVGYFGIVSFGECVVDGGVEFVDGHVG